MIKLVVFDWNGTILSDTSDVVFGVNARLKLFSHGPISVKRYQEVFQIPSSKIFESLGIDAQLSEIDIKRHSQVFYDTYEARAIHARTRSGAREVLKFLKEVGVKQILLSNHMVESIVTQCKRLKLTSYFDTILANDNSWTVEIKGKKDRLIDYLKSTNFKPNEVLIIGDSIEEIEIGKELGLHTVSISGGFVSTKRLKDAKPDVLIHNLRDLIEIVKEVK